MGLRAVDARGRELHAWLDATAGGLLVRVDARGARYPLRIDPFVQQGAKLVGTGTGTNPAFPAGEGFSVALSGDGKTALVGNPDDNGGKGAVWVFTRSGTTWTQQGAKLVGTGAGGDAGQGSAWRCRATGTQRSSAAPATTARTAVGAVWVFTRSGTTWTQQGPKLVGTGAAGDLAGQGWSVALSGDGNTALVGGDGDGDNGSVGAVWVFTRSGTTWTQQGPKLVGTGAVGNASQGFSVSLSGDGNTALVGAPPSTAT